MAACLRRRQGHIWITDSGQLHFIGTYAVSIWSSIIGAGISVVRSHATGIASNVINTCLKTEASIAFPTLMGCDGRAQKKWYTAIPKGATSGKIKFRGVGKRIKVRRILVTWLVSAHRSESRHRFYKFRTTVGDFGINFTKFDDGIPKVAEVLIRTRGLLNTNGAGVRFEALPDRFSRAPQIFQKFFRGFPAIFL